MSSENDNQGFELKVKVEKRDGYFAAITKPFAITAYGNTAEEAESKACKAVLVLLDRHPLSDATSFEFLKKRKVKLKELKEPTDHDYPIVSECSREMRLAGTHG